jgi:gliding motility-associated-like protein
MKQTLLILIFGLLAIHLAGQIPADTVEINSTSVYRIANGLAQSTYICKVSGGELKPDAATNVRRTIVWGDKEGLFPIKVSELTIAGCTGDTSTIWVLVTKNDENAPTATVPNIFTPNADNQNEQLTIKTKGASRYFLQIFNRWGKKVFESTSPNDSWDGKHKGLDCAEGTYFYILNVANAAGKQQYKGYVELVR